jgi:anaerobic selenocysteine-containing dehydrogenase
MLTKLSACPLDCPDTCTLTVEVDDASERLLSVEGDERNPLTEGTICGKVRRLAFAFGDAVAARGWDETGRFVSARL